jgi:hypothetical protein
LPDGGLVATVTFVAPDGRSRATYRIVARTSSMQLELEGDAMPFEMHRAWSKYWGR